MGRKMGALESMLHCLAGSAAGRVRLGKMKIVGGNAVAGYFRENGRAARTRGVEIFQCEDRGAFSENHSGAISIKGAAFFWRRGLKRIEADKNQLRERVITAAQYALIASRANALEGMTDRVRACSAGVGNYLARPTNAESI